LTKVTITMDDNTKKKLDYIRAKERDNRSIQKELEWLIEQRYAEIKVIVGGKGDADGR
jgi:predicted transcriptional regulator